MITKISGGILKPDCTIRNIYEQVFKNVENNGFHIQDKNRRKLNENDVFFLYGHNSDKPFYSELVSYMTCHDSIIFTAKRCDGRDAVKELKKLVGYYMAELAEDGTIRKKYAIPGLLPCNVIHSPDTPEENRREIKHFFPDKYPEYVAKRFI